MKQAKDIISQIQKTYPGKTKGLREERHAHGLKKKETVAYWLTVDRSVFKDVMKDICKMNYPYLAVISGRDCGNDILLIYHLYFSYGAKPGQDGLNLSVYLPKAKPILPTISDLIPGAELSEKEKQEMLGVKIEGIGDDRAFLPAHHPEGDYPWRKEKNA